MVKLLPVGEAPSLDLVFHALSDSTRRSILRSLAPGERTVSQIAQPFTISLAAVSKHLNVLENARLITRERRGCYHFVRINGHPMKEAEEWLTYYERFWNERLDALENLLDETNDR